MPKLTYSFLLLLLLAACSYTQKVKDGTTAYERKQYAKAAKMLEQEFGKSRSRIEKGKLAYMLAQSHEETGNDEAAIRWFKTAYDNQYGVEALRDYAFALKRNEQYEEAARAFKEVGLEIGSPYEYRKEIAAVNIAQGWKNTDLQQYEVQPVDWNSNNADYGATPYENGQLVFSSDRSAATGDETYQWTGNAFSDLFVVDPAGGTPRPLAAPINSADNEGAAAFNADFTELYFTRCFGPKRAEADRCQLMYSRRSGDSWAVPVVLPFVKEGVNYGQPALSDDGAFLYFVSDDPEGWGGKDIYVSERTPAGWTDPKLLGRNVNTERDDMFPHLDADTLYFASQGHTGMGGLDVFSSYQTGENRWSPPQNLRPPVNSGQDDFGYVVTQGEGLPSGVLQRGFFTSARDGGVDNIYRFEQRVPPPPPAAPEVDTMEEVIVYQLFLDGFVLEKIYQDPNNPNSLYLGRKPLPGSIVRVTAADFDRTFEVGEAGSFSFELQADTDYNFFASAEGYLNTTGFFSTKGIAEDPNNPVQRFELELVLDKIYLDREITLDNIYYDFDKADIRPDAEPTLRELQTTLVQNPDIRIQLASHTDCRGNDRYNENLSQRRAQAAVDYLIGLGIEGERLSAKGYGEAAPTADCFCSRCTEEEHQANRRTTFKILEM